MDKIQINYFELFQAMPFCIYMTEHHFICISLGQFALIKNCVQGNIHYMVCNTLFMHVTRCVYHIDISKVSIVEVYEIMMSIFIS